MVTICNQLATNRTQEGIRFHMFHWGYIGMLYVDKICGMGYGIFYLVLSVAFFAAAFTRILGIRTICIASVMCIKQCHKPLIWELVMTGGWFIIVLTTL